MAILTTPEYAGRKASEIPFDEYEVVLEADDSPRLIGGQWSVSSGQFKIVPDVYEGITAELEGYAGREKSVYLVVRSVATKQQYNVSLRAWGAVTKLYAGQNLNYGDLFAGPTKFGQKIKNYGSPWVTAYFYFDQAAISQIT